MEVSAFHLRCLSNDKLEMIFFPESVSQTILLASRYFVTAMTKCNLPPLYQERVRNL